VSNYFYILRCSDRSYYVGTTRDRLAARVEQHQAGVFDGYTASRRPVTLVFQQEFQRVEDAITAERQVKGWRRDKKDCRCWRVVACAQSLKRNRCVLRDALLRSAPQDEEDLQMAIKASLILRSPRSGRLEGRTTVIRPNA